MITVYVLKLEGGKWYVGVTNDMQRRYSHHIGDMPGGASFTRMHRPLKCYPIMEVEDRATALRLEDEVTVKMTSRYGPENVRGGSWAGTGYFTDEQTELNRMMERDHDSLELMGVEGADSGPSEARPETVPIGEIWSPVQGGQGQAINPKAQGDPQLRRKTNRKLDPFTTRRTLSNPP